MPNRLGPGKDELSRILWQLRTDSALSGTEAARRAGPGFSQAKVSRIERGQNVPTPDDAARLALALGASRQVAKHVARLAQDLHEQRGQNIPARVVLHRGADNFQRRIGRIEASSEHVTTFAATLVPGLLQSSAYARTVFASGGYITGAALDEVVQSRLDRQQLLREPGHRFTLLTTEGALRWCAESPAVMIEQLEHIARIDLPNVRIGVIPWGTPARVFPLHSFDLFDERAVLFGTETSTGLLTDPQDVAAYLLLRDELIPLARFGDDAQELVSRIAADYRQLETGSLVS